jgi:hypothetical protein
MLLKQYFGDWETLLPSFTLTAAKFNTLNNSPLDDFPEALGSAHITSILLLENYDAATVFIFRFKMCQGYFTSMMSCYF